MIKGILVLSLSSLDYDSRIIKTIRSLKSNVCEDVYSLSVNSIHKDANNFVVSHLKGRVFGVPGLNFLILYFRYLVAATLAKLNKIDIVHANDLVTLPAAVFLKAITWGRIKIVYDAHEYETEVNGLGPTKRSFLRFIEKHLIRFASAVITVSDSIAVEYTRLYGIDKPKLVLNCPKHCQVVKSDRFREYFGIKEEQKIFLYQGGLGKGRGIEILLSAFDGIDGDDSVLVVMGYGPLCGMVQEAANKCDRIFYHPAVDQSVLLDYTSSADYGILFYEDTCLNHRFCSPNKMFEYLMGELPVLTSNLFEMRRLTMAEGIGVVAETNSIEGFKDAISEMLSLDYPILLENVRNARSRYCWEEQEKVLFEVYAAIQSREAL